MLELAVAFLVAALVAANLGFGGIACGGGTKFFSSSAHYRASSIRTCVVRVSIGR